MMGCKTSETQIAPTLYENVCQEVFKTQEGESREIFKYKEGVLVQSQRWDADGRLLFTTFFENKEGSVITKLRKKEGVVILKTNYRYVKGRLVEVAIDDTDVFGKLIPDGSSDLFEYYEYDLQNRVKKINIKRENFEASHIEIKYDQEGKESGRTTFQGKNVVEIQQHFYKEGRKIRTEIEHPDLQSKWIYTFSYDEKNRRVKTLIQAKNYTAEKRTKYKCE